MKRPQKLKLWWQKLLLSLVSTLIFLLLVEVVSAVLFKTGLINSSGSGNSISLIYDYDLLFYNEPSRTVLGNFKDIRPCRYTTNSLGFREDAEITEPKPRKEYRILCVGDSSTFGITVDQSQTYPAQLQALLDARKNASVNYRVINGGCVGFTSFQALRFMECWLEKLKPDLVIYSIGFNDSTLAHEEDKVADYRRSAFGWLQRAFYSSNTFILVNQFAVINKLIAGKKKRAEPNRIRVNLLDYEDNVEQAVKLAQGMGITVILCPISVPPQYLGVMREVALEYKVPMVDAEESLWRAYNVIWNGANEYDGQVLDYHGEIDTGFSGYAETGELQSALMRTKPYVFDDSIHPNPIGYRAIAEDLVQVIP
jgi:lysophospholipase L1-like esterase